MRGYCTRAATRTLAGGLVALGLGLAAYEPAMAQQTANRVEAFKDWSVFTADANGPVCWIVTQPQSSSAKRGGKPVSVRRGDIYLNVSFRPEQGVVNEVSMVAGYPFRDGSEVTATIGSSRFKLFTNGENAWPRQGDDVKIIEAMKKGSVATFTGVSSRGTTTTDRFSLLGFTDALGEAGNRCK